MIAQGLVIDNGLSVADELYTVTRTIGRWAVQGVGSAGTEDEFAVGLIKATEVARAAGVASLPKPDINPNAEWLYWFSTQTYRRDTTSHGLEYVDFDVRSQRIVQRGERLVWIVTAQQNTVAVGVSGRILMKLK